MYSLELSIAMLPKALNKSLNAHWRTRHKVNLAWDKFIAAECWNKMPAQPVRSAKISITRHAHRMLDYDGLVGSMKPLVDALVTAGVLADDSWKVLGKWEVDQKFRPKKEGPLLAVRIVETQCIDE